MTPAVELPLATGRRFAIEGMDCAGCAQTLQKAVGGLADVHAAQVSFGAGTMTVDGSASAAAIQAAVTRAGYRARPLGRQREAQAPFWRRDARAISTAASVVLLAIAVTPVSYTHLTLPTTPYV